jgi:hypothetical protein
MVIRTLDSPAMSTKLFSYFAPVILVLVLLPMLIDYFNCCMCARSLGSAAQKIMGEPSLIFTFLWFGIYLELSSEKYTIMSWKKK